VEVDQRVPGFLGRVLDGSAQPVGTCFQVVPDVLVTAWHVLDDLGAGDVERGGPGRPAAGWGAEAGSGEAGRPGARLGGALRGRTTRGVRGGLGRHREVELDTRVAITGVSEVEDPGHSYRYLDTSGEWKRSTTRDDQVPLGRLTTTDVVPGMSGAPVRRRDDVVIGVVSARYNSTDDWLRGTVWVARVENLAPLLDGLAEVSIAMRRRDGAADLILTIDQSRVRLSGSGAEVVAEHRGVSAALAEAVRGLAGARSRLTTRHQQAAAVITPGFPPTPQAVGLLLAESFLPAPVADELARVIADAESCWVPVRLGMVVDGELRGLPWEALPAPGTGRPLALHPLVTDGTRRRRCRPPRVRCGS